MNKHDALVCAQSGVAGIWVSNAGGKSLDTSPSTIAVLPAIVSHLRQNSFENVEVYIDGGIRRGTDVMKCLAFGAKAVFLNRPVAWALAHKG